MPFGLEPVLGDINAGEVASPDHHQDEVKGKFDYRRLSRAVGAHQAGELTGLGIEVQVVQGRAAIFVQYRKIVRIKTRRTIDLVFIVVSVEWIIYFYFHVLTFSS